MDGFTSVELSFDFFEHLLSDERSSPVGNVSGWADVVDVVLFVAHRFDWQALYTAIRAPQSRPESAEVARWLDPRWGVISRLGIRLAR